MGIVRDCRVGAILSPFGIPIASQMENALGGEQCGDFSCFGDTSLHVVAHCQNFVNDGDPVSAVGNLATAGSASISGLGATRPTWHLDVVGGKAVYRFDGTQYFSVTSGFGPGASYTLVVVAKQESAPTGIQCLLECYKPDAAPSGANWNMTTSNRVRVSHSDDAGGQIVALLGSDTGIGSDFGVITMLSEDSTTHKHYVNSTLNTSSGTSAPLVFNGSETGRIGSHDAGGGVTSNHFIGDIAEMVLFIDALSDADREAVESCLIRKYRITDF